VVTKYAQITGVGNS